ncbi:hypothetical protein [Bordetella sp. FB-8]|uniref:hypothetical protein n=1 Tax=Bordetella sp. FB-8 TaxID=1159870 RepID=UPI0018CA5241
MSSSRRLRLEIKFAGRALVFVLFCSVLPAAPAAARQTPFADFIMANGALTVFQKGDYVEPYSAIKALLVAHSLGVDVRSQAVTFSKWIVQFQQANGPFPRICRSGGNLWLACGPSDADDSLAVLWCALGSDILPTHRELDASCDKALDNLETLWDPQRQTFRAVFGQPGAYFADNVEVMAILRRLRANRAMSRRHARVLAKLPSQETMLAALQRNYGYNPDQTLEPTAASMPPTPYAFYPYAVAPIYPLIYDVRTGRARQHDWQSWRKKYGAQWLAGDVDYYPWGLIAWAAYKSGDKKSALAWLHNATRWKAQGRWNIMEEGVRLGLDNKLKPHATKRAAE